jgi:hypothetical protein
MAGEALDAKITAQGLKIREMKAAKATVDEIKAAVAELLEFKNAYKTETGSEWKPPAAAAPVPKKAEKAETKKDDKAAKKGKSDENGKKDKKDGKAAAMPPAPPAVYQVPKAMTFYPSTTNTNDNMRCLLCAGALKLKMPIDSGLAPPVPRLPALSDKNGSVVRFGANAICRYLAEVVESSPAKAGTEGPYGAYTPLELDAILDACDSNTMNATNAQELLGNKSSSSRLVDSYTYPSLVASSTASSSGNGGISAAAQTVLATVEASEHYSNVNSILSGNLESLDTFDFNSAGLLNSLKLLFSHAIIKAFPRLLWVAGEAGDKLRNADVARCNNPKFGDFQCNSAMGIAKAFKETPGYSGTSYIDNPSIACTP